MSNLLPRWRLWHGLCPECNSDAPAIDTCKVCESFSGIPSRATKAKWWGRYSDTHGRANTDTPPEDET